MNLEVRFLPTTCISIRQSKRLLILLMAGSDLERSTAMFGRLADGNAMAQIMYGLALRSVSVSSLL